MTIQEIEIFFQKKDSIETFFFIDKINQTNIYIKREDLLHPEISGNKFRKLKYNVLEALKLKKPTIVTLGGAYSNHIAATAAAGNIFNIRTIGIIRGEELQNKPLNHTLSKAKSDGMELQFVSREMYRKIRANPLKEIKWMDSNFYFIPEGGANDLGLKGCIELGESISDEYSHIVVPCGTGNTLAGIVCGSTAQHNIIGIPVLKEAFLQKDIEEMIERVNQNKKNDFTLVRNYHFGGYAKLNHELLAFKSFFENKYDIPLDPIYTLKSVYGTFDLIHHNFFPSGSNVLIIHTGGLQGQMN